jgi:hypothetical protein
MAQVIETSTTKSKMADAHTHSSETVSFRNYLPAGQPSLEQ